MIPNSSLIIDAMLTRRWWLLVCCGDKLMGCKRIGSRSSMVTHVTVCASDAEAASLVLHVMSDCYVGLDCSLSLAGSGAARCVGSGGRGPRVDARVQQRRDGRGLCVVWETFVLCVVWDSLMLQHDPSRSRARPLLQPPIQTQKGFEIFRGPSCPSNMGCWDAVSRTVRNCNI